MAPCKKCYKNNWDYKKLDNDPHIYCKCKACGYEFKFVIPKKNCMFCGQPADFEKFIINDKTRGKKCLLCGKTKVMERARGQYKKIDGVMKLLWHEDEEYHEVALMDVGKGASQIIPID